MQLTNKRDVKHGKCRLPVSIKYNAPVWLITLAIDQKNYSTSDAGPASFSERKRHCNWMAARFFM